MSEKIKIRKVKKIELEICHRIIHDCINFIRVSKELKDILRQSYSLENIESSWKEFGIYVSEKTASIKGTGRLEKTGEIRMIYVDPYFHNQGFGKKMIEKLESLGRRRGYKKVFVHALSPAKGFYKKVGFKKDRKLKNGTYYMEKRL